MGLFLTAYILVGEKYVKGELITPVERFNESTGEKCICHEKENVWALPNYEIIQLKNNASGFCELQKEFPDFKLIRPDCGGDMYLGIVIAEQKMDEEPLASEVKPIQIEHARKQFYAKTKRESKLYSILSMW